ncbi:MAG TPA: amidohydrolase family protein [Verrucomicrobiae bacterium]|jgi:imidazolonepropionase-like amidohydrolase
MNRNARHLFFALALAAGCLAAKALRAESLLLKNATVHPVSGPVISPGDVLIENGKVTQVGRVDAKADKTIDLTGQHLYPGLVALNTDLGLVEIESVRATIDEEEVGAFVPEVQSWVAVNPDSELLPVARANGIAYFEPTPAGSAVAGQSGLVKIDGWTTEEMVVKKPAALRVYWPSMEVNPATRRGRRNRGGGAGSMEDQVKERERKAKELADYFADARAYAQARAAAQTNGAHDPGLNPSWEAMLPYVRGELPIIVYADELRQIKSALQWAETNHYKIVVAGGRDAWKASAQLAKDGVPVIYTATYGMPGESVSYDLQYRVPGLLHQAGVKVALSLPQASMVRNLPYAAAQSVSFGWPADEAIKAMTLYPAQIMGVDDRLGAIEAGKDATLFSCSGDILDLRANVTHMWMTGREVSLEDRHTRLYDKYRNRPKPH